MGVKHTVKKNGFPDMIKELESINGTAVQAGVFKGKHQWLAGIHEFGCDIRVTPKMRGWLHHQGVHLKKDTTVIHIPERSFLRTGYDSNRAQILKKAKELLLEVARGSMTAKNCQIAVGIILSSKIKDYATDLSSPPNSSLTVERKGSSNPLADSGDMIGGITWRVKK